MKKHGVPNLVSKSLQTTRRFDALKLWMGLEALGQEQYAAIIDHGVTLAQQVAAYVKEQPALELVMQPQLASVLFRFRPQAQMAMTRGYCPAEPENWRCAAGVWPRKRRCDRA